MKTGRRLDICLANINLYGSKNYGSFYFEKAVYSKFFELFVWILILLVLDDKLFLNLVIIHHQVWYLYISLWCLCYNALNCKVCGHGNGDNFEVFQGAKCSRHRFLYQFLPVFGRLLKKFFFVHRNLIKLTAKFYSHYIFAWIFVFFILQLISCLVLLNGCSESYLAFRGIFFRSHINSLYHNCLTTVNFIFYFISLKFCSHN
jgi:hypothetical protein